MEHARVEEEYRKIAEKVMEDREDLHWIEKAGITIGYLASDAMKRKGSKLTLGECIKIRDLYRPYIPHDFLIVIYEEACAGMSREQMEILLYHELLHIGIDEKGEEVKLVVNPHDVEDFRTIIDQFGIDWAK